jgi:hypothetical protein
MATTAPNQIPSGSYDGGAVSVVVSNRSSSDPRPGAFFDQNFAAAAPVHFHELDDKKFLGLFSRRWYGSSRPTDATDPNLFSSYTEDNSPSWAIFDGSNGNHLSIPGQYGINPPTGISCDSRVLVGACSRANSYLYMLQSYTVSGTKFGVVSHFHIDPNTWQVNLVGEEKISSIVVGAETIVFDRGIKHNVSYLHFAGRDSLNRVYLARKNWGFAGKALKTEYQSDKGWTEDPLKIKPLKTSGGYLTSAGPIGFGEYRGKVWASVVGNNSGVMTAQFYTSSGLWDAWTPENRPYPLGTEGTSYLGGTAYLQPMLRAHPSRLSPSCVTGIPLLYVTKKASGGNTAIDITWDLWPVPAQSATRKFTSEAMLKVTSATTAT